MGLGKLGSALGLRLKERGYRVVGSVKTSRSLERALKLGLEAHLDNALVVEKSDVVLLSVKPHNVAEISIRTNKPVVSFVAGIPLARISGLSARPFRAMTNIGLTAIAVAGEYDKEVDGLLRSLSPAVIWVEEKLLDPLTVVLGSGPALVARLLRAYIEAAVNVGVPWDLAREIAASLFSTAPQLAARLGHEGVVEMVATPGGTTIKALIKMAGLEGLLATAVEEAVARLVPKS
ncbi:MAG: pyrroline-5-carboxylate reductase [Thermoproteus sp. JCHS_4]|nr:MAG: pyrroline-5-carboxylate reductase [Thermoproteus sp. JCHS_4]